VHVEEYGMIAPVGGCFPPDQGVPGSPSTALREGGCGNEWRAKQNSPINSAAQRVQLEPTQWGKILLVAHKKRNHSTQHALAMITEAWPVTMERRRVVGVIFGL
jgi:hypothetical protein